MGQTRKQKKDLLLLPPEQEATLIAYIVFYDLCEKETCWQTIGTIIQEQGKKMNKIVYRGHSKKGTTIQPLTPFFSTSPVKKMAELFVETDWSTEEGKKIGNLFKIHLKSSLALSTKNVHFSISKEVLKELKKRVGNKKIVKGSGTYTFEEYIPLLRKSLNNLVKEDDEEILVLTGGTFYKNKEMTLKGYSSGKAKEGYTLKETWYTN